MIFVFRQRCFSRREITLLTAMFCRRHSASAAKARSNHRSCSNRFRFHFSATQAAQFALAFGHALKRSEPLHRFFCPLSPTRQGHSTLKSIRPIPDSRAGCLPLNVDIPAVG